MSMSPLGLHDDDDDDDTLMQQSVKSKERLYLICGRLTRTFRRPENPNTAWIEGLFGCWSRSMKQASYERPITEID